MGKTSDNFCKGQVFVEYAIMLIFAMLLVMGMVLLANAIATNGSRMVDLVSYDLP